MYPPLRLTMRVTAPEPTTGHLRPALPEELTGKREAGQPGFGFITRQNVTRSSRSASYIWSLFLPFLQMVENLFHLRQKEVPSLQTSFKVF